MQYPIISVIMPAYNAAELILQSVESFLLQSYPAKELIIINDGSTDKLLSVLSPILKENKDTIKYLEQENKGVSAARNLGVSAAQGEWVAFLDADDIWFEGKLISQWNSLNGNLWSHTDSYYFGVGYENRPKRSELSEMHSGQVFENLIMENFITTSSVLINKQMLIAAGAFDEKLEALEDWMLWLIIASNNEITYVDKPLLDYRVHPASTSRKARKMLPLHLKVIDEAISLYRKRSSDKKAKVIEKRSKIKAYTILSYIAEASNDKSFATYCSYSAWKLDITELKLSKRLLISFIKQFI